MDTLKKQTRTRRLRPELEIKNRLGPEMQLHIEETIIYPSDLPPNAKHILGPEDLPLDAPAHKIPPGVKLSPCGKYWIQY